MVFTGLAIASAYTCLWGYYWDSGRIHLARLGVLLGGFGFVLGLVGLYTVGIGEFIAALPLAIHVLNTNE